MEVISLTEQEKKYMVDKPAELFLEYLRNDLYLVDSIKQIAYKLPEKYYNTPFYCHQYTSGYDDKNNLINELKHQMNFLHITNILRIYVVNLKKEMVISIFIF